MIRRLFVSTLLMLTFANAAYSQTQNKFPSDSLRSGDLVFAIAPGGNAITDVTRGVDGLKIDHVGMVYRNQDSIFVMEATGRKGVGMTPLAEFIHHNSDKDLASRILIGRVKSGLDFSKTYQRYQQYEHLPYDTLFMPDDRAMYCSELVQKIAVDSLGHRIFPTIPMSFHDKSGKITAFWKRFYRRFGMEVPEGAPGTNPGQLSRDPHVRIMGLLIP